MRSGLSLRSALGVFHLNGGDVNLANTGLGRECRGAWGKDEGSLWERGLLGMCGRHACVDVCKGVCVHS